MQCEAMDEGGLGPRGEVENFKDSHVEKACGLCMVPEIQILPGTLSGFSPVKFMNCGQSNMYLYLG